MAGYPAVFAALVGGTVAFWRPLVDGISDPEALRAWVEGYGAAAPLIGFAMVLDTLDGRIARLTGATSEFGEEFDSLADVISFGLAPAILVFAWGLQPFGRIGWAVGFIYMTATAMR